LERWVRPLVCVVVACAAGCSGSEDAEDERLLVLAASSLQFALPEIAAEFELRAGVDVDIVLGSSGNLVAQIENGAPADLLLSADRDFVDRLEAGGWIVPGTRRDYARGRIALVVPAGRRLPLALAELGGPQYTVVALANPETAPYGLAAREALEAARLWDELAPRVVFAENIAQAAQFVLTGNADAGVLALSVILEHQGWEHRLVDEALHAPVVQSAAVIAGSEQPVSAGAFLDFLTSPDGVRVLSRFGFGPPAAQ